MRKKIITIPRIIILVLILIVATMGIWLALRSALVRGISNTIINLETQGYEIAHGGLSVQGFPLTLRADSDDIQIRTPRSADNAPGSNWFFKTDRVRLSALTLNPLSWKLSHKGDLRVDVREPGGERYMFDMSPANLDVRFKNSFKAQLKHLSLDLEKTRFTPLAASPPPLNSLGGAQADLNVAANVGDLKIRAQDLIINQDVSRMVLRSFGDTVSALSLDAEIENWLTLEQGGVEAWQAAGGRIKSTQFSALWGAVDITGDFDIKFVDFKPEGLIHINVREPLALMKNLADSGLIDPNMAAQAQLFIGAMSTDDTGRKSVELVLKDGVMKYGFITLHRF